MKHIYKHDGCKVTNLVYLCISFQYKNGLFYGFFLADYVYIGFTFGLSDERQQIGIDLMDQASTLYSLQVIWDSDSDTEVSSVNKQTDATGLDHEKTVGDTSSADLNVYLYEMSLNRDLCNDKTHLQEATGNCYVL